MIRGYMNFDHTTGAKAYNMAIAGDPADVFAEILTLLHTVHEGFSRSCSPEVAYTFRTELAKFVDDEETLNESVANVMFININEPDADDYPFKDEEEANG